MVGPEYINMENYATTKFTETEHNIYVTVEYDVEPTCCQSCGIVGKHVLSGYGKKPYIYMDLPSQNKRVGIKVIRQRYKCRECGSTFYEKLPEMDDSHNATRRLIKYIEQASLDKTYVEIADEVGLDEKTIRNIFRAFADDLLSHYHRVIPKWVGVDEIYLRKKPRFVFTNLVDNTFIDMLENRLKETVTNYFFRMKDKHNIQIVAMDMWNQYREAVYEALPWATIIVDKYHLLAKVNNAVQDVRKSLKAKLSVKGNRKHMKANDLLNSRKRNLDSDNLEILEEYLNKYPALRDAYNLKEMLFDFWNTSETKEEAIANFDAWSSLVKENETTASAFKSLLGTFKNWHTEIFNYFDHYPRITNALTESLNSQIRTMDRRGKSYTFEVIRIKTIFRYNFERMEKPKFDKKGFREGMYLSVDNYIMLDYYLKTHQPIPSRLEEFLISLKQS